MMMWAVGMAGTAWASLAGDLVIDGHVTVASNLTVRGTVQGLDAGAITNGVLPSSVMPTNGVWDARNVQVSNLGGVDADTVDGLHAPAFATATQGARADRAVTNYQPTVAFGSMTITGPATVQSNLMVGGFIEGDLSRTTLTPQGDLLMGCYTNR
jgi:hypothetical protein